MKFPITRKSLQEITDLKERVEPTRDELKEEELYKILTIVLERVCRDFTEVVKINSGQKEFVWKGVYLLEDLHWSSKYLVKGEDYSPQFLERLKETFIGCNIYIDHSISSVLISWY